MDSQLMERLFSNEHSFANLPSYSEYTSEEVHERVHSILEHMGKLHPMEADILELHLLKKVPQSALGKIFGYTQPNIHYRVNRAMERVKILIKIPVLDPEEMRSSLSRYFSDKKDIEVMVLLYLYSSQSHAAREIGESQGKVRYRFLRCLHALEQKQELSEIYEALKIISDHLTLLRRPAHIEEKKRVII